MQYKRNYCVVFFTKVGRQGVAIGNFIKYDGGVALTHNKAMPPNCIYVAIATSLQAIVALPYPLLDYNPSNLYYKGGNGVYNTLALEPNIEICVNMIFPNILVQNTCL